MYFTELIDYKEQAESPLRVLRVGNEEKKRAGGNLEREAVPHAFVC